MNIETLGLSQKTTYIFRKQNLCQPILMPLGEKHQHPQNLFRAYISMFNCFYIVLRAFVSYQSPKTSHQNRIFAKKDLLVKSTPLSLY